MGRGRRKERYLRLDRVKFEFKDKKLVLKVFRSYDGVIIFFIFDFEVFILF